MVTGDFRAARFARDRSWLNFREDMMASSMKQRAYNLGPSTSHANAHPSLSGRGNLKSSPLRLVSPRFPQVTEIPR
ncbi:hypothetical protein GCM10027595_13010 [Corynebacterium nasicanis]